jgi:hypothetical protein
MRILDILGYRLVSAGRRDSKNRKIYFLFFSQKREKSKKLKIDYILAAY